MYPNSVIEASTVIYEVFEPDILGEFKRSSEWCKPIGIEVINKFLLPKFINGEGLFLEKEEVDILYRMCLAAIGLKSLEEKGLVIIIEDENGEEVVVATEKGKSIKI